MDRFFEVVAFLLVAAIGAAATGPTRMDKELYEVESAIQSTIDNLGFSRKDAGDLARSLNGIIDRHRERSIRAQLSNALVMPTVADAIAVYIAQVGPKLEQLGVVGEVRVQLETLFERQLDLELRILRAR